MSKDKNKLFVVVVLVKSTQPLQPMLKRAESAIEAIRAAKLPAGTLAAAWALPMWPFQAVMTADGETVEVSKQAIQ